MAKAAPRHDAGDEGLRVAPPKRSAAGIPGVIASARALNAQMGLRKGVRTMLRINQPSGFDCPGCAWPDPHDTSRFEFCENGAKAVAEEATDRAVTADFFAAHSIAELAGRSDYWLGQQGRLTEPVHRPRGGNALPADLVGRRRSPSIGGHLRALASPDRAVFYTSGRTSNEAAFLYQLFVRAFGTNNLPDCSNMCHESSGVALGETIGIGKGTVTLDDIHAAELILVVGQNPGTNHPRMLSALERGQARRRHDRRRSTRCPRPACIAFRNPQTCARLAGRGTALADLHVPVAVGADLALFQWVNRRLVRRGAVDRTFVAEHCDGLRRAAAPPRRSRRATRCSRPPGVEAGDRRGPGRPHRRRRPHRRLLGDGPDPAPPGRGDDPEIVNTAAAARRDRPAAAPDCARCAATATSRATARWASSSGRPTRCSTPWPTRFAFTPPRHHGYDTVAAIAAMAAGDVDVFVGLGGNFVAAAPDTDVTGAALERCALTVQVSTKLNRSHVRCGAEALILPCLGRTEIDRGPDGRALRHRRGLDGRRARDSRRQRTGVARAAQRGRHRVRDRRQRRSATHPVDWSALAADYDTIRDHIAATIPGFADFNELASPARAASSLPNAPRDTTTFPTVTGRARLTVNRYEPIVVPPGRLLLQTVRSHDQFNTTIYGLDDRYRGVLRGPARRVRQPGGPRRPRARRRCRRRHRQRVGGRIGASCTAFPGGRYPTRRGAAPPTSPRPTSSCRSTASPRAAGRRRRRRSSSVSSR